MGWCRCAAHVGRGSLLLKPFNSNRFWSKEICNGRLSLWAWCSKPVDRGAAYAYSMHNHHNHNHHSQPPITKSLTHQQCIGEGIRSWKLWEKFLFFLSQFVTYSIKGKIVIVLKIVKTIDEIFFISNISHFLAYTYIHKSINVGYFLFFIFAPFPFST